MFNGNIKIQNNQGQKSKTIEKETLENILDFRDKIFCTNKKMISS